LWSSQNIWTLKNDLIFEQNRSNVDCCVKKPNFTMFASEPNQNPSCEIIFFLNEKLNPNGARDPNFLLTPGINKFALQKEEKKLRLPWSCIMFNSLSSLPPPWPPNFFHTKYTYCQALSSPVCSVRIRQNPAKYNY